MNDAPLASVVVPTCNRPPELRRCLQGLDVARRTAGEPRVEVIVSDDGSDDRSRRMVAAEFPWVMVLEGPRRGPACNRNFGAAQARGDWLLFIDDDCIPDPGCLTVYLQAFGADSATRVFEGRTRAERPRRRHDEEAPVNEGGGYLWSCNMAIEGRLFRDLGGFCEAFAFSFEDVDLRLRLAQRSILPRFLPEASVCHPWRPARGMAFLRQHNAAYRQLLARHPELRPGLTWRRIAADALRLQLAVARDAARYGPRGSARRLYAAVSKTLIDTRFKLVG